MLESFSARGGGASPPWDPLPGRCPWTPMGAKAAPRPPAQLGPMEISAVWPSAHQQKFPTISLYMYGQSMVIHVKNYLEVVNYSGVFVL